MGIITVKDLTTEVTENTEILKDFLCDIRVLCGEYFEFGKIEIMDETKSLYELMGEEKGIHALVTRFYDLMETAPEAKELLAVHPKNLKPSRQKLFLFLMGWSGGPQTYIETRGHPALRRRHNPFAIGPKERDQWFWCMDKALDESGYDEEVVAYLKNHFKEATEFLRNRE